MSLLIEVDELAERLDEQSLRLIDARFSLQDINLGKQQYLSGHIPTAVYADLEQDLSGAIVPGITGRHPLPDPAQFAKRLQSWGISETTQVVIYDDGSHAMAARCWWLLEWAGLSRVRVLHGGINAWVDAGLRVTREARIPNLSDYVFSPCYKRTVTADDVLMLSREPAVLLDARGQERYAGRLEPIDPVAGHIPGAVCMPFTDNMDDNNRFLSPDVLAERFRRFYSTSDTGEDIRPVCYCGSGVTACHNILAMRLAGLPWPALYPGSWSEWITDPARPVATGD
ncbi:sulfurtransferase [Kistimonas asteriae]|uniref:sulfurtransferase n=1 Tax=Kistimonas asteriae TaxID=517724 RepID=UPI001BAD0A2D|nr:sulfurtransferase [Kistimonas asteriae]